MSTEDFPAPADWPAAQTFICGVCNEVCRVTSIEKGSITARYVCEQQHDTMVLAKRDPSGEEWEFGDVPF